MNTFIPVRVVARLAAGVGQAAPWGIALDGLLAAELWADRKAWHREQGLDYQPALDVDVPPDLELPLARCTAGPSWHWAATCAYTATAGAPSVHYWTGRIDHRSLEQVAAAMPATLSERQGRYRARRMPLLVTDAAALTWHAVGDPERIEQLVAGITAVGKKRSQGEGHVLNWTVTPAPDLDEFTAAHLYPDGRLGRPTPAACLAGHDVDDGGVGTAGLRAPYMHPARQETLHLPALLDS